MNSVTEVDLAKMIAEAEEVKNRMAAQGQTMDVDMMQRVLAQMTDGDGVRAMEVFATALTLCACLASLMPSGRLYMYNPEADKWMGVEMSDVPPDDIDGAMMTLDGTATGFVRDGVHVDTSGVTPVGGRVCRICGQEGCEDGTCAERRRMLAAVRNMGRVGPQEGLRDVDAKGGDDE